MLALKDLLNFIKLTHQFQQVKRVILVKSEERQENDLEHSCQLALSAWYIITANKLKLNKEKVIKYALAHDLVEIYAGDANFYDIEKRKSKIKLEKKSVRRIAKELPAFKELHTTIRNYELRKDPESKFVYALDKILPILNIYLDKGRTWRADGVTLEMLITHKTEPVSHDKQIASYFKALVTLLKRYKHYFPKSSNSKAL